MAGTAAAPKVAGLQGNPVSSTAPNSTNQFLGWMGTQWAATVPSFANISGIAAAWQLPSANSISQGAIQLSSDLGGTAASPVVDGLQGRAVSSTTPTTNQVLTWNGSAWAPANPSGGGGGSSSGPIGNDAFSTTWTSATVLTINPNASTTDIAVARFGATAYRFTSSATATISAGTGTAYIYLDNTGNLDVGDNGLTVTCSGCMHASGITAFPTDSIPLFTWTATSGTWNSSGGTDYRAPLSSKKIVAGMGIVTTESNGNTTVSVDPSFGGIISSVPADANYTPGLLGCPTSSGKIGNCSTGNPPVLGVLMAASGSNAVVMTSGFAPVTFSSATPTTHGDFICVDPSHPWDVIDNGSTPCTTKQIGIVVTDGASAITQTVFVQLK